MERGSHWRRSTFRMSDKHCHNVLSWVSVKSADGRTTLVRQLRDQKHSGAKTTTPTAHLSVFNQHRLQMRRHEVLVAERGPKNCDALLMRGHSWPLPHNCRAILSSASHAAGLMPACTWKFSCRFAYTGPTCPDESPCTCHTRKPGGACSPSCNCS